MLKNSLSIQIKLANIAAINFTKLVKKFLPLIFIFFAACGKLESPVIYFSNVSPEPIKDIQCRWGRKFLNLPTLNPGDSRSQSFYLSSSSDFFDSVSV